MSESNKIWTQREFIVNHYTLEVLIRSDGYLNKDFRFNFFIKKEFIEWMRGND